MSLQDTPRASRLHIGIFGLRNSGKSSLINAITGQGTALVSPVAGTTTDPVFKSMELHGIGPVVFIDTAGFDDPGELGQLRVERTRQAMEKTDLAILVFRGMPSTEELHWAEQLKSEKIPFLPVLNQIDLLSDPARQSAAAAIEAAVGQPPLQLSAKTGEGIAQVRPALLRLLPADFDARTITGSLAAAGDVVLLVMPQDLQAPKGRLILPQVQTIRELLDKRCCVVSCTFDTLDLSLQALHMPPRLIITDSQIFRQVWEKKPSESLLTSFSVLMAAYKGDIAAFVQGAAALDNLNAHSRVLIAEACTHAPLTEDIGREKIPAMLRKKYGATLQVDVVAGTDFPSDLSGYDLIIHCGGCMFNRRYVLTRLEQAQRQQVPMTNYGVTIAALSGILGEISLPTD
jgi:[FeFe] hydrogenase H-cluster maturation GTPase HydF